MSDMAIGILVSSLTQDVEGLRSKQDRTVIEEQRLQMLETLIVSLRSQGVPI